MTAGIFWRGPASGVGRPPEPLRAGRERERWFSGSGSTGLSRRASRNQDFLDLVDDVERHLAMVFHRFIEGGHPALRLSINGRTVASWDPFLPSSSGNLDIARGRSAFGCGHGRGPVPCAAAQGSADSQQEQSAAGPHGWTAQQGFYVYRNRRLLLAGSWLGLGQGRSWTKEEAHRLARIRLDIPNSADAEWKIDIRKSTASPPVGSRPHLTRLAEDTRARARRCSPTAGSRLPVSGGRPVAQAWRAEHSRERDALPHRSSASGRPRGSGRCGRSLRPHQGHAAGNRGDGARPAHLARHD